MMLHRLTLLCALPATIATAACRDVAEVLTPLDAGSGEDAAVPDAGRETSAPDGAAVGVVTLDVGSTHACMTRDGALYCWGQNQRGRLGVGDALDRVVPTRVGAASDWRAVTASEEHSCAVRADGSLYCFGVNDHGQLGLPGVAESLEPARVELPPVKSVSAESNFTCALAESGALFCWGDNFEGQLGQHDRFPGEDEPTPLQVEDWTDFTHVDAGQGHTCALRAPGTLWCWGRNSRSELGFGEGAPEQTRAAAQVGNGSAWIDVDAGQNHSCGVESDGTLSCWGDNQFGNLGTGDYESRSEPTAIGTFDDWVQVSIDTFHSCAIDRSSELYCWGRNVEGQLGVGDNADRAAPERVPGGDYAFVAVGRFFTCALRLDGSVWCAGANESGQLGVGDRERRNSMTPIATPVD